MSALDDARMRLERHGLGHAFATLLVLSEYAHDGPHRDDQPRGFIAASNEWLQARVGRHQTTITAHIHDLIDAGELAVWTPHDRRNARAREYLVVHMATRRGLAAAERRALFNRPKSRQAPPKTKAQYQASTSGTEPLFPLAADGAKTPPNHETLTPQGPVPSVDACSIVSTARASGHVQSGGTGQMRARPSGRQDGSSSVDASSPNDGEMSSAGRPVQERSQRALLTSQEIRRRCPSMPLALAGRLGKAVDALERDRAAEVLDEIVALYADEVDPFDEVFGTSYFDAWEAVAEDTPPLCWRRGCVAL